MNIHERRRKMTIGISYIEEVVADVLREARDNSEGSLNRQEVRHRAKFPSGTSDGEACQYILSIMENRGEVVNYGAGPGPDSWSLTG